MKFPWFKRTALFFFPCSVIGWIIFLAGIVFSVYTFIDTDSRSHSVSDTLINFSFNLFLIFLIYSGVAFLSSRKPDK